MSARTKEESALDRAVERGLGVDWETHKRELLKDPEFRREFESLGPEFEMVRSLIALRIERGWTQKELAERADTKQPAVARIESGRYRGMSIATLERIADALDARLVVHFEEKEPANKKLRRRKRSTSEKHALG